MSDQLVAVGFCRERPVTDRRLSGFSGAQQTFPASCHVVAIGPNLPVESLVTSTIRLDDINEAMDHLADALAVRQLISFTGDL